MRIGINCGHTLSGTVGGGAVGWRMVAIIYSIIGLIVNTISVLSVKELSEDELNEGIIDENKEAEKYKLDNKRFYLLLPSYNY